MADPREVTATLVVGFGADSGADNDALVAEIDTRETGLNSGKSSFNPGEDVWILLYASTNVTLNDPVSSWGDLILRAGDELVDKEQDLQFVDTNVARVTYPILSGFTPTFIGRDASPVAQTGEMNVQIVEPAEEHYARLLRLNYTANARAYRLTNTLIADLDTYNIICHFTGIAT